MTETEDLVISGINNQGPFNEMLFQGLLSAKSRQSLFWSHTGPTLLRTTLTVEADNRKLAERVGIDLDEIPLGAIVGIGNLLPVRRMNAAERAALTKEMRPFRAGNDRYEFTDLIRFPGPVFWNPPQGVINWLRVPFGVVQEQLEAVYDELVLAGYDLEALGLKPVPA